MNSATIYFTHLLEFERSYTLGSQGPQKLSRLAISVGSFFSNLRLGVVVLLDGTLHQERQREGVGLAEGDELSQG